ncbi:MAG: PepSY domain-containing protein [Pseudomonadota bacterium]
MTWARLITAWLTLLLATGPVIAAPFHHPPLQIAQRDNAGRGGISLDEAVAQTRQQHKGKVLSAETTRVDGRKVYRIKILTKDGRVKRTRIDARTGQTMSRGR